MLYNIEHSTLSVNIVRATAEIAYIGEYRIAYNPNGYDLNIVLPHSEVNPNFTYYINDEKVDSIGNVGVYTVNVSLDETEHYNDVTEVFEVEITKVVNTDNYRNIYSAVYGDNIENYELPVNQYGTWSWKTSVDDKVGNAGTTIHKAQFIPYDTINYEYREILVTFNISSKKDLLLDKLKHACKNGTEAVIITNIPKRYPSYFGIKLIHFSYRGFAVAFLSFCFDSISRIKATFLNQRKRSSRSTNDALF